VYTEFCDLVRLSQNLTEKLYAEYTSGRKTIGGWGYSYAFAAFAEPIINHSIRDRSEGALGRRVLAALMKRFQNQDLAEGSIPVWLILPDRDIVEKGLSKYGEIGEFSEKVAGRIGLAVLNMNQPFRTYAKQKQSSPIWRPKDIGGHLSPTGHKLVADHLYLYISDNGLLRQMPD